jgi:hypothetical protein
MATGRLRHAADLARAWRTNGDGEEQAERT